MKKKAWFGVIMVFVVICCCFVSVYAVWAAEKYPSHPVTTVTLFAPGGISDLDARLWSKYLEKYLGGTFVVDHKPGGGGVIGITYVANAKPDGYTLGNGSDYFTPVLQGTATYKMEDLRIIAQLLLNGCALAVNANAPWKTWQEFVDYAKKNPGVKWGHQGAGTMVYFRTENLNRKAGLKLIPVPLKGDSEIISGLLGNHVAIGSLSTTSAKAQADAGKLRILFHFDDPKLFGLSPSIASMASFYPKIDDIEVGVYYYTSSKVPEPIINALEGALEKMSKEPEYLKEVEKLNQVAAFVPGKVVMQKLPVKMDLVRDIMKDTAPAAPAK
jgi:tripartite-type tricarboxylate transporter receptor subunit TctC